MMNSKIINLSSLLIYLLSITQVAKRTVLSETLEYSPWSFSELLISYPDQFIRRGLIGETIHIISSDTVLFDTVNLVVFINFVIFTLLSFAFIKLSNLSSIQHFLYLISIFGILNISMFNQYFHRKEMFVLNLFLIILLTLRFRANEYLILIISSICSILMILIHEGIAMITIPFIVYLFKKMLDNSKKVLYVYTPIVLLIFLTVILGSGSDSSSNVIWENLSEFDKNQIVINPNAITAIGWSVLDSFLNTTQILIFSGSMFLWTFYFFMVGFTLFVIFNINFNKIYIDYSKVKSFLVKEKYFLVIPVLFVIGFDWGRWLFSLFHLCFFSYLTLKENTIITTIRWTIPMFILAVTSIFTIMPECCLQMSGTIISSNYYRIIKSMEITLMNLIK
jgi:hypothetical protein